MTSILLSAFSDEYAADFTEQLEGMNRLGIRRIELRFVDGKNVSALTPSERKEAVDKLQAHGIEVSAVASPLGKIRLDEDLRAHADLARKLCETAEMLGAPYLRVFSFYAPEGERIASLESRVFAAMEQLVRAAEGYRVTLCHENEARIYGDTPVRCRRLLDHFGGKVKCVFDMGNFVLEGIDPVEAYPLLQKDIAYFHVKDARREGAIVPPGKGDARISEILRSHRAFAKEDFFASLEPHLQLSDGHNALVGRSFENPYQYPDAKSAFCDAVKKFSEVI